MAEAEREKALAAREQLVREHPRVSDYAVSLASSYRTKADGLRDGGQALESLDWYGRGIRLAEDVLKREPRHAEAREVLSTSYWGRALALSKRLLRHKEALPDWERALAHDDGDYGDEIRAHLAITYARLGDHARAAADMRAVEDRAAAERKAVKPRASHVMAYAYALASSAAADDTRLATTERARLSAEYADRAVQVFRRLHAQGHFKQPEQVEDLRHAPEFEGLRRRDDFQQLLRDMSQSLKIRKD